MKSTSNKTRPRDILYKLYMFEGEKHIFVPVTVEVKLKIGVFHVPKS